MGKKIEVFDQDMTVGRGWSSIHSFGWSEDNWSRGVVALPEGYVTVYTQGSKKHRHHSSFRFIYKERLYLRGINKKYAHMGLARKAREFAKAVMAGEVK